MVLLPAFLDGLARSVSMKKGKYLSEYEDGGKEIAKSMMKNSKKNSTLLGSSGFVSSETSKRFTSICTNRGEKGINQDRAIVWEGFGCQEDITFCGMFDGHGAWGHKITKRVKRLFPASLLCQWQQTLASLSSSPECFSPFDLWKQACMKTFSIIDLDLKIHPSIDSYCSGCTALTAILQGDHLVVANAGDSRAVIATTSDDGVGLVPVQLSVDFKPNIPEEAERIKQSDGRLFCLDDEPGMYRVGMPNGRSLGLAVSRAFGDYCLKDFGLVSEPEVTYRKITSKDQFLILATDGQITQATTLKYPGTCNRCCRKRQCDETHVVVGLLKTRGFKIIETKATMISDLPRDVAEEVLSRLPVTSLGRVRSTCKKWNTLTKDEGFIKKHLGKNQRRKVVMLLDYKVYLMSIDLLTPPSIERIGKLVSLNHEDPAAAAADGVDISCIFHCDGLLLCITKDKTNHRLVVWNPYSGQTRWIEPRDSYNRFDRYMYALGYKKNNCSLHKLLRFVDFYDPSLKRRVGKFELYSFNSNS
ncbi:unnamed protein product [Brassica napus]|uniref:(rape) hypothetical protein n=1 Tax=Brassica napus TaxID=3708 RepID=A0A816UCT8_BRANA|nr:unnamed protein product [Brassica napus]